MKFDMNYETEKLRREKLARENLALAARLEKTSLNEAYAAFFSVRGLLAKNTAESREDRIMARA